MPKWIFRQGHHGAPRRLAAAVRHPAEPPGCVDWPTFQSLPVFHGPETLPYVGSEEASGPKDSAIPFS